MNLAEKSAKDETLLEKYAGLAMQGLIAAEAGRDPKYVALDAVAHAKALIAELEKQTP